MDDAVPLSRELRLQRRTARDVRDVCGRMRRTYVTYADVCDVCGRMQRRAERI